MTFLEKLERDGRYKKHIDDMKNGIYIRCPHDYGYEQPTRYCIEDCVACWNREAGEEPRKDPFLDFGTTFVISKATARNIREGRDLTISVDGEVWRAVRTEIKAIREPDALPEIDVIIRLRYGGHYGE